LYRILRSASIDGYRKRRREPKTVPDDWCRNSNGALRNVEASAEATVFAAIPDERVQLALSSLPKQYQQVVLLFDVEGFT